MKLSERKAGVLLTYLSQAYGIVSGMVYMPFMLRMVNQSEFGLYSMIASLVGYLNFLSLGFNGAYIRFYSIEKNKNNRDSLASFNGMFLMIFLIMSFVATICGVVLYFSVEHIFGASLTPEDYHLARKLMILLILNTALTFPNTVFECSITANEKFIFLKIVSLVTSLLGMIASISVLLYGFGTIGLVSVTTTLLIMRCFLNVYFAFKKTDFCVKFGGFQWTLLKEMGSFTVFILMNQVINTITWQLDKTLLGIFSGTKAVAVYSVGSTINVYYQQLAGTVASVFIPQINRIAINGENPTERDRELSDIFIRLGRIQFMVLVPILVGFLFWGRAFLQLWAGNEYSESYYVAITLMMVTIVPYIQSIGNVIQQAKNKHQIRAIIYLGIAVINALVSIPFMILWGPVGAALGTVAAVILGDWLFINVYYQSKLGIDVIRFWKNIIRFLPAVLLVLLQGIVLSSVIKVTSWASFVCVAIVFCLGYTAIIWITGMNREEKDMLRSVIKR